MVSKIFIDSRHRSSGSAEDFEVSLQESINFPSRTKAFIDEACIPASWFTIDDKNDKFYFVYMLNGVKTLAKVTLVHRFYTATQLAAAIEFAMGFPDGHTPSVSYLVDRHVLFFSMQDHFYIPNNEQLEAWGRAGVPNVLVDHKSCNSILEHELGPTTPFDQLVLDKDTWESPGVDVNRFHSIFIHSSLADNQTIMNGKRTSILKKVSVNASHGEKIFGSMSNSHDWCDVSNTSARTLRFTLKDREGRLINLQGHSWSLSVVFDFQL